MGTAEDENIFCGKQGRKLQASGFLDSVIQYFLFFWGFVLQQKAFLHYIYVLKFTYESGLETDFSELYYSSFS